MGRRKTAAEQRADLFWGLVCGMRQHEMTLEETLQCVRVAWAEYDAAEAGVRGQIKALGLAREGKA